MQTYITINAAGVPTSYWSDAVHGMRRLQVADPAWVRPTSTVTLQPGESITVDDQVVANDTAAAIDVPGVPDLQAAAPLVDGGPNPDTHIPLDALEITQAQYRDLIDHAGLRRVTVVAGAVQVEVVAPPAPVVTIPTQVSMRQARLALLGAGLLAQVNAAIEAMPGVEGDSARIEWEYAQEVRRDSPLVQGLGDVLGLTDAQLDDLFTAASAV